jgi:hypothetical protein
MWSMLIRLVTQLAAIRWLFKLGGLALLLPIAAILKVIGVPLLAVLSIVGVPVMILLFLFGLPVFLVVGAGVAIMGVFAVALMLGLFALKIFIFVVLPIMLIAKIVKWVFRKRGDEPPPTPADPAVDPLD